MLAGCLVVLIGGVLSFFAIDWLKRKFPFIDGSLLKWLYVYHFALTLAYYVYTLFDRSDSHAYFYKVLVGYRGENWADFYGTSTTFIEFVAYPFIIYLGFTYEAMMAVFSLLGYFGFVYFYIFFKENIRFKHYFLGYNLLNIIFFLPNFHFWSSSLGKGSFIFFGVGLFFFGISQMGRRYIAIFIGGLIIYHIRPHIMLVILISSALGFIFSSHRVSIAWRILFLASAAVAFFLIYQDVLSLIGVDEEQFLTEGFDLTHRANELTKATSGVDITSYSLPMQVFTFLYRPLFFDAPGGLGLIVSFENVFYLLITLKLFGSLKGIKYLLTSGFLTKTAFLSFITVSIALAQISGNLGLAIRQKSQVMILFLFVVISFMESQKMATYRHRLNKIRRTGLTGLAKPVANQ